MTRRNVLALTLGVTLFTVAAAALSTGASETAASSTPAPVEGAQVAARSGYIVASS